tara:strand:- start:855 stop:1205 length:351 start_codon:yes stop_codon:yes gene_type:complete
MASLITCPHCGTRPKEEFTIRGDASPVRPQPGAAFEAWDAYVHLRDNVRGPMKEHWQHSGGCRRWLVVERDTFSHAVHSVVDAAEFARGQAGGPGTAAKPARPEKAATAAKGRGKA